MRAGNSGQHIVSGTLFFLFFPFKLHGLQQLEYEAAIFLIFLRKQASKQAPVMEAMCRKQSPAVQRAPHENGVSTLRAGNSACRAIKHRSVQVCAGNSACRAIKHRSVPETVPAVQSSTGLCRKQFFTENNCFRHADMKTTVSGTERLPCRKQCFAAAMKTTVSGTERLPCRKQLFTAKT